MELEANLNVKLGLQQSLSWRVGRYRELNGSAYFFKH